jgi:uncharacterized integral membrane protein
MSRKGWIKLIVVGVCFGLVLTLMLLNDEQTVVKLFFWRVEMPLFLLPLIAYVLGAATLGVGLLLSRRRQRNRAAQRPQHQASPGTTR